MMLRSSGRSIATRTTYISTDWCTVKDISLVARGWSG